jgi:hypothetical protein
MPDTKISALPLATTIGASDTLVGLQGGDDKQFPQTVVGGGLLRATITLTDAQIKALPTAPNGTTELFATLGANKGYIIIGGYAVSNIVAPYTNQTNLQEIVIGWNNDNYDATGALHNSNGGPANILSASTVITLVPALAAVVPPIQTYPVPTGDIFNKNLALYVSNGSDGDFTGGNAANTLKITVLYTVADV